MSRHLLISVVLLAGMAAASASEPPVCAKSAEDAALELIEVAVKDPRRAVALFTEPSLRSLRLRLEQLADSRYSPASDSFRTRFFGPDWGADRLSRETDAAVVGQYLSAGQEASKDMVISNARVTRSTNDPIFGRRIEVTYEVATARGKSEQRREFTAYPSEPCWKLDVPVEAWVRIALVSQALKKARSPLRAAPKTQPPTLRLDVAEASDVPFPGAQARPLRAERGKVWVAPKPLATESNILAARADWDCNQGLDPEAPAVLLLFDEAGTRRIAQWTAANVGKILAVSLDDQVVVYAKVTVAMKDRLSICLAGATLEEAQLVGARLTGAAR
jgi:hypothetical protein